MNHACWVQAPLQWDFAPSFGGVYFSPLVRCWPCELSEDASGISEPWPHISALTCLEDCPETPGCEGAGRTSQRRATWRRSRVCQPRASTRAPDMSGPSLDLPFLPGHQLKAATRVSPGDTNRRAAQSAHRNNKSSLF